MFALTFLILFDFDVKTWCLAITVYIDVSVTQGSINISQCTLVTALTHKQCKRYHLDVVEIGHTFHNTWLVESLFLQDGLVVSAAQVAKLGQRHLSWPCAAVQELQHHSFFAA